MAPRHPGAEPALAGTEQRVHPVLDELAEARLEMDLRQHGVLRLLEAVEQVLADAVELEDGRGEIALLHPRRGEQHEGSMPIEAEAARIRRSALGRGRARTRSMPGRGGGGRSSTGRSTPRSRSARGFRRADVAAEHARAQRAPRANSEHLAEMAKAFAAEPRGTVGGELVGSEEEEVHRRRRCIPAQV